MEKYDKIATSFQKFFNHEELSKVIDSKLDKRDLEKRLTELTPVTEHESVLNLIDSLYKRLRQVSLMQVEISRSLVPSKTSSSTYNVET